MIQSDVMDTAVQQVMWHGSVQRSATQIFSSAAFDWPATATMPDTVYATGIANWLAREYIAAQKPFVCVSWERLRQEILPPTRQDPILDATLCWMGIPNQSFSWMALVNTRHKIGKADPFCLGVGAMDQRGVYFRLGVTPSLMAWKVSLSQLLYPDWREVVKQYLPRRAGVSASRVKFIGPRS